jgi:hypothetical protein
MYARRKWLLPDILVAVFSSVLTISFPGSAQAAAADDGSVGASLSYVRLPLAFEENCGQAENGVRFVARGAGYGLYLRAGSATLTMHSERLQLRLAGSQGASAIVAGQMLPGKSNYFFGRDPSKWITGVPQYSGVTYRQVYPGIDLVYHGDQNSGDKESGGRLEYDFLVAPGADPSRILLAFDSPAPSGDGPGQLSLDDSGDLLLAASHSTIRQLRPRVYQVVHGQRQEIPGRYVLAGKRTVRFELGEYDRTSQLVIDPVLLYGTVLPGSGNDSGLAVAADSAGNAYVTGYTSSSDFLTASPLQGQLAGGTDVFVSKVNAAGTALVYSTYIGGSENEQGQGIAVDSSGNVYVAGWTNSTDFPTHAPLQSSLLGTQNAFALKLNAAGSALVYSTYLGGSGVDQANAIAIDSSGAAYLTGSTNSVNFPAISPLQAALGATGAANAFIAKINAAGSSLVYSTYLGGSGSDTGAAIAVDSSGNVVIAGSTTSANFPVSSAVQSAYAGGGDAFIAKLNAAGSQLVFSTFYGGTGQDNGYGIALDPSGNIYVSGFTSNINVFPVVAAMPPPPVMASGFLLKLNASGSAVSYATILNDEGKSVAVDSYGNAYVTYISRVNASGTGLDFSLPLSGTIPNAIALDSSGNVYVTGYGATIVAPPIAYPENFYNVSLVKEGEPVGGPRVGFITPATALASGSAVTVKMMGTGFVTGASATLNGAARTTTFVSATEVDVALTIADVATARVSTLLVTNPTPAIPSNPVVFTVKNPSATISSLSPASATAGGAAFTLTVNGTGFVTGSAIYWNGTALTSTIVSSTQMTASVPATDLATAAIVAVQVAVPTPGGGLSTASSFAVNNPAPVIASLSPSSAATGGAAFTLTVTGSNFVSGSVVQWNGSSRATTFISKTQLQAAVLGTDIASAAVYAVTVLTPAPGGGTSASANFAVSGPAPPVIASLSPSAAYAGTAAFTLTVNGSGFLTTSQVQWKGANRTTIYVSATQLTAAINASDVAAAGTAAVTVVNSSNGTTSVAASFTINSNPLPQLSSLQPSSVPTGTGAFTLTVNGSNFVSTSTVQWNGSSRSTTMLSSTQLTAAISAADLTNAYAAGGTAAVTVVNPAPGGGTSSSQLLAVTVNPAPVLAAIQPASAQAGAGAITLTVAGSGFLAASVVQWNGASRATTYVSSTQLTAAITTTDLAAGGTIAVTVMNPSSPGGAGGGTSAAVTFTINNPAPAVSTISPTSVPAGSAAFSLTVTGSGFVSGSQVQWNGANRVTTYVNATQLTAAITAADIATGGTATVAVINASPGGGASTGLPFTITSNPVPTVASILPSSANSGSGAFALTITGSGFVAGSQAQWGGANRVTTFISATQITAAILATDVATAATVSVTVVNPTPGGGTSSAASFAVNNPVPAITALSPATVAAGAAAFSLTISGSGFVAGSQVQWNGSSRVATYVSATQISAAITAADVATGGTASVTVINATPGGGTSTAVSFTVVSNPAPQVDSILPASSSVSAGALTLTVIGSGFLSTSQVKWNGASRTTTYVGATELTAAILASDLSTAGTAAVTVVNPTPGGGTSAGAAFAITNPTPAITTIAPATVAAASSAFSLTVNGSGFVATSVVQWNGSSRMTTYVSATQLSAAITAADVATAGTASVSVLNASPGGGTSGALSFAITANPAPTLSSILPVSAINNSGAFTLSVSGSGFILSSQVQWNGSNRVTTYASATQLTAAITSADLATVGTATVTVTSPAPGGGTSSGVAFAIAANPTPSVNSILPSSATIGASALSLTVAGSGFISTSQVQWNGASRATTYVSSTQLTAAILTSDLTTAGIATVTVFTPTPGGGTTGGVSFTITANPTPSVASILPASATVATGAFTLTVTGSNFVSGALVQWNGASRATTFVSTTQLTAAILSSDLSTAGTATVTVVNPSNGGTSGSAPFTIGNPTPVLSSITPATAVAGSSGFTLTLNGSGFVAGSVVQWNGASRATVYLSATQITAAILAADIASSVAVNVTVMNPTPGGGTSIAASFAISANPAPTVASILPSSTSAGSGAQVITVTGSGFITLSQVQWGGANRTTTYVSATQLTAAITAADVATAGTAVVTVVNPASPGGAGGGTSGALTFTVTNPTPAVSGLLPASIATGSSAFTLTATGTGFVGGSQVQWNGTNRTATFVSATQITAAIAASDVATAGTAVVTVVNPGPGGGSSVGLSFAISSNPVPMVASILPASANAGSSAFALTVTGSGFVAGTQVQWNGTNRTTTFISATQVTAAITLADVATAGSAVVTVVNAAPGGGTSSPASFTINNPSPAIASLSPATAVAGSASISVSITGTGFVAASVVQWNGSSRVTTFTSTAQISVAILAADLAAVGSGTITVVNPTPGGGTSSGSTFTITSPNNPAPVVASISPSTALAGASAITLSVTGTGFIGSSQVQWNGGSRVTSYVSATQLNATIAASDLLTAETATVTVTNPTPGGGTASGVTFAINNPAPSIGTIAPVSVPAQSAGFTLTVNGSGFVSSSVVQWAGSSRVTSFVSATQLSASITSADVATVGSAAITVVNATPGGGTATAVSFTVTTPPNPVPAITTISPGTVNVSNGAFTLLLNGSGFLTTSQIQWNGSSRVTTYVSPTQLNAAILATDLSGVGTDIVTVVNPASAGGGGGTSAGVTFTVTANPTPSLASILPASANAGSAALSLTIAGSGFVPTSQVQWNGSSRATSYIGSTQLIATITAADLAAAGTASVTVMTPTPGGGSSAAATFSVNNPAPAIASIAPETAAAGSAAFSLTVNGSGFIAASQVEWNGSNRTTTYVSATQLTAAITATDVAAAATATVTVINATPGGGTSAGLSFAITANPAPVLSGIQPSAAAINSGAFTLTLDGSGFISTSQVKWSGANRTTTFVSSTQLTAAILATDLASTGTAAVTVVNPAPGGGTSSSVSFTITPNPAPTLASILPASANAASGALTLTLTGSGFFATSQVQWGGANRTTTYVSATQLTAAILAADVAAAGTAAVTVVNPTPGGGTSTAATFTVNNPAPSVSGISPATATAGSGAFALTVNGAGFVAASQVQWNGASRVTTYVSATQVTAAIAAADVASAGSATVTVVNSTPGGGTSSGTAFAITSNPVPTLAAIQPSSAAVNAGAFTLTVSGGNFVTNSVVQWNGVSRATTFVSSSQLTAAILATDLASTGTTAVTVVNPTPGGGTSSAFSFTITPNPAPTVASILPASVNAGSSAFALTVTGSGFLPVSQVQWNGANRTTTYVSSTQLAAAITAADVTNGGTTAVTVVNPAPGGGTSATATFSINNPAPGVTQISPSSAIAGSGALTLSVTGSGFVAASTVQWNGASRATTYVSATQLSAAITAADIATAGTATVTVVNPTPGGGTAGGVSFTVTANPAPVLSAIQPSTASINSGAFTLTLNGSGFVAASQLQWNGSSRATTFLSATQLTAAILASDVAATGSAAVTVVNPAPGGGTSAAVSFTVTPNPLPVMASIQPASANVGSSALTLTVTGNGFVPASQVQWNGASRTATYVSATQLIAAITTVDLASAGTANVTVVNPASSGVGGGTSAAASFTINNPAPVVNTLSPATTTTGSPALTLTVNGSGFVATSQVQWNGANRVTTFAGPGQLNVAVTAADVAAAGTATVTVVNAAPGGGTSGGVSFTITSNPVPVLASILPAAANAGTAGFTLTVTGSGFTTSSQVQWNGTNRVTAFSSATQLTAAIAAADVATAGTAAVTVMNPAPGGGTSASATFSVNNPVAAIASITPNTAVVGSPAIALTVSGNGFVAGSQVSWNGSGVATTYIGATQLTATIPAGSLASVGTVNVAVVNATPGGGTSLPASFTITSNPAPVLASILPVSATVNSASLTLTATGSGFTAASQVLWNGAARATTYVSPTQLTAAISATDLVNAGVAAVTVSTPAPGGGTSTSLSFTIGNPAPSATVIAPTAAVAGSGAFTLSVTGTGFLPSSQVQWNGSNRTTTYVNAMQLSAAITAADLSTSGPATVAVLNPTPGGGLSGALSFAITSNPIPVASALQPSTAVFNSGAFTLSVTGSGFVATSQVQWNGSSRATTYISATQLTAAIAAADLTTPGAVTVTVVNPAPGGGTSAGITLVIGNPAPAIAALSPATVTAGATAFSLTVNGSGFQPSSIVQCNGSSRATTYVSGTQLSAAITAADVAAAGAATVTVATPSPGGGTSASMTLTISGNPLPSLAALLPASAPIGSGSFNLAVIGVGFNTQSVAQWNGANRVTTFVSTTEVSVAILASDLASAGMALVTVTNPSPGGGSSGPDIFTITGALNPVPTITSLSPPSASINTGAFTLTVNGSGFVGGSQVQWNGTNLTTTYVGSTQLTAAVPAANISNAGSEAVTVVNPLPGGGTSNSAAFPVNLICTFTLTPPSTVFPATAATGTVAVAAAPGCVWSAASLNSYLTITSGSAGSGNGTVSFALTADSSSARVGTLAIAGQDVTISQNGTVQGVVSVAPSSDTAGGTVLIPITLVANSGISADKIAFSVQVTPNGSAPPLTGTLGFTPDPSLGTPSTTDTSGGAGLISLSWLSPATTVSGTQNLGTLLVTTPSSAVVGQTYTVQVTGASASFQLAGVALTGGSSSTLTIRLDYLEGDNYPYTGDMAGSFGDNTLNTLDLIWALRAVTNVNGYVPPTCSDRFDAMDTFPADTATTRGGDGILNTLDLIVLLQRATNVDPSRPRRVSRGLTCSQAGAQARRPTPAATGSVEVASDGSVYLVATKALSLDGLAISVSSDSASPLAWTAADGLSPALTDTEIPGALAVAWMQQLELRAGSRLLLGTATGGRNFTMMGTSANSGMVDVHLEISQQRRVQ